MCHAHSSALIPSAITVATPAPTTPQRKTATRSTSSPAFITLASARKITGVLLSPTLRSAAARMLYWNVNRNPTKITCK